LLSPPKRTSTEIKLSTTAIVSSAGILDVETLLVVLKVGSLERTIKEARRFKTS
jgi:hypothetical protein